MAAQRCWAVVAWARGAVGHPPVELLRTLTYVGVAAVVSFGVYPKRDTHSRTITPCSTRFNLQVLAHVSARVSDMNETHRTSLTPFRRSLRLTALVLPVPVLALLLAFALTRSPASIFIAVLFVVAGIVCVFRELRLAGSGAPTVDRAGALRCPPSSGYTDSESPMFVFPRRGGTSHGSSRRCRGECDETFTEKQSGKSATDRPQLQALIRHVRRGDHVVVA